MVCPCTGGKCGGFLRRRLRRFGGDRNCNVLVVSDLFEVWADRIGGPGAIDWEQGGQELEPPKFAARRADTSRVRTSLGSLFAAARRRHLRVHRRRLVLPAFHQEPDWQRCPFRLCDWHRRALVERREPLRRVHAISCQCLDGNGHPLPAHLASWCIAAGQHESEHHCALRQSSLDPSFPSQHPHELHPGGQPRNSQRRRSPEDNPTWLRAQRTCDHSIHTEELLPSDGRLDAWRFALVAVPNDLYGYGCIGSKKPSEDARPRANQPCEVGNSHLAGVD